MEKYPFIFSDEPQFRFRRHLAFWVFWGIFQGFLYSFLAMYSPIGYLKRLPLSLLESFIFLFAHMFLAYSLIYFVIPRFLLKQKYWHTAVLTISLFVMTACFSTVLNIFVIDKLRAASLGDIYTKGLYRPAAVNIHLSLLAGLRGGLTVGGIAAAIKLMKYWYVKEQRNLQLQKENAESQLQLLKAQVHPHFLFNTLNNIYSYTQDSSPTASRLITKLSDLLRFVLYEGSQPLVTLDRELKMIQDYIALEKIRYGNKLDLDIRLPERTNNLFIAPLLLLPLIENCFKHGTSSMIEQPWISLHITIRDTQMHMKLVNGKANTKDEEKNHTGIGIENVKKRLDLLYPGKNSLTITNEEDVFIVNLKIELEQKKETELKIVAAPEHSHV